MAKTNQYKFNIEPGSMYPDVEATKLDDSQHQLLTNVKMSKDGEWETIKGYLNSKTGITDLRAGIEVTDDDSGDRFILFQDGYGANCLKRLNYDSGDGDGYENETPTTIALPSGITVSDTTLRFFYFRGVVRITGGSKPMWYGYIDRTLFEGAIEYLVKDTFDSGVGSWLSNGSPLVTAVGVGTFPFGITRNYTRDYALHVDQNGSTNSFVYRTFSVKANRECTAWLSIYKDTGGGSNNVDVKIGTVLNAADIASGQTTTAGEWQHLEFTFTPSEDATLYFSVHPNVAGASDEIIFTWAVIEQDASITIGPGWFLEPAEVVIDDEEAGIDGFQRFFKDNADDKITSLFSKMAYVYDDAQNTLPGLPYRNGSDEVFDVDSISGNALESLVYFYDQLETNPFMRFKIIISGTNLRDTWTRNRVTRLIFILTALQDAFYSAYDDNDVTLYINQDIDLTDSMDNIKYNSSEFEHIDLAGDNNDHVISYYKDSHDHKIKGNTWLYEGAKVTISNENGEIESARITLQGYGSGAVGSTSVVYLSKKVDGTLITGTGDLGACGVSIVRRWVYDSATGYTLEVGTEPITDMVTEYYTWADISALTKDTNPNYSHHAVVAKRGNVISLEDEEADIVRYSPVGQIDVFPNVNTFTTEVGDTDQNLAIVERDGRVCILKRNSLSQMSFSGSVHSTDIPFDKNGLYATNGYIVIDNILYFMDKAEVYAFTGTQLIPLLKTKRQRSYYRDRVQTTSFIGYNKLDQELMLFVNGAIMVYQFDYDSWYIRSHDITAINFLLTIDQEMYLFDSSKFVRLNHSLSTFDEDVTYRIETKYYDRNEPEKYKKVELAEMFLKSNKDVIIEISDPVIGTTKNETKTPNESYVDRITSRLNNYLFKAAKVIIRPVAAASNLTMTFRKGHVKYSRIS